jgi:pseudaminic acid cytidylyltransferase
MKYMRLVIIPARGGSQRIPNKNIAEFCGEPLITYSLKTAKDAGLFDEIHVSTESDVIRNVVEAAGFKVPFLRSPDLADNVTGLIPVVKWVLSEYQKRGKIFSDVCLLMATAPLTLPSDLISAYEFFCSHNRIHPVMAISSYPVPIEWALNSNAGGLVTPCYPGQSNIRSQDLPKKYYDAGAFGFYSANHLLNNEYSLGEKYLGHVIPRCRAVDIDEQEDFELARSLYCGANAEKFERSR